MDQTWTLQYRFFIHPVDLVKQKKIINYQGLFFSIITLGKRNEGTHGQLKDAANMFQK